MTQLHYKYDIFSSKMFISIGSDCDFSLEQEN